MKSKSCPECNSKNTVKRGKRYNKSGVKQRHLCRSCDATFIESNGFERMRHGKKIITRAIHLHNNGLSLFLVQDHIWQHDGVKVSREAIRLWVKKYSSFLKSSASRS